MSRVYLPPRGWACGAPDSPDCLAGFMGAKQRGKEHWKVKKEKGNGGEGNGLKGKEGAVHRAASLRVQCSALYRNTYTLFFVCLYIRAILGVWLYLKFFFYFFSAHVVVVMHILLYCSDRWLSKSPVNLFSNSSFSLQYFVCRINR